MRRSLLVAAPAALVSLALWWPASPRVAASSNPGRVTSSVNARWTGTLGRDDHAGGYVAHDQVSVTLNESCIYNVTSWTDTDAALELDRCNTTLSAAGSGSDLSAVLDCKIGSNGRPVCAMVDKTKSWTYTAQHPTSPVTRLSLGVGSKIGSISFSGVRQYIQRTEEDASATTTGGLAVDMAFQPSNTAIQHLMKGNPLDNDPWRFKLTVSGDSVSGSNTYSDSWGDSGKLLSGSGSFTLAYTVSGGAPQAETEVEIVPPPQYEQW